LNIVIIEVKLQEGVKFQRFSTGLLACADDLVTTEDSQGGLRSLLCQLKRSTTESWKSYKRQQNGTDGCWKTRHYEIIFKHKCQNPKFQKNESIQITIGSTLSEKIKLKK